MAKYFTLVLIFSSACVQSSFAKSSLRGTSAGASACDQFSQEDSCGGNCVWCKSSSTCLQQDDYISACPNHQWCVTAYDNKCFLNSGCQGSRGCANLCHGLWQDSCPSADVVARSVNTSTESERPTANLLTSSLSTDCGQITEENSCSHECVWCKSSSTCLQQEDYVSACPNHQWCVTAYDNKCFSNSGCQGSIGCANLCHGLWQDSCPSADVVARSVNTSTESERPTANLLTSSLSTDCGQITEENSCSHECVWCKSSSTCLQQEDYVSACPNHQWCVTAYDNKCFSNSGCQGSIGCANLCHGLWQDSCPSADVVARSVNTSTESERPTANLLTSSLSTDCGQFTEENSCSHECVWCKSSSMCLQQEDYVSACPNHQWCVTAYDNKCFSNSGCQGSIGCANLCHGLWQDNCPSQP